MDRPFVGHPFSHTLWHVAFGHLWGSSLGFEYGAGGVLSICLFFLLPFVVVCAKERKDTP